MSSSADRENALLLTGQDRILKLVAAGTPLNEVLDALSLFMEDASGSARCSVLLLDRDGRRLRSGSAPSIPAEYSETIDGFEIGATAGSCGTACHRRERVIVRDTLSDPLWDDYRHLAQRFGLLACTSAPIIGSKGQVLGAFAFYYSTPTEPSTRDLRLIETSTALAGLAIERQQTEDALHEREERLEHARRMEAVGRLAGGIAHDFNNLLTIINGYGDTVLSSMTEGEPHYDEIVQIRTAGDRAAALTRQLLTFSRKQVVASQAFNVNDVVDETKAMLARVLGEDVELVTHLGKNLGDIVADPSQISQILVNLAINARDAMAAGGTLTITTRSVSGDALSASRSIESLASEYTMIAIADTGCGMDAETQRRAFEPFFTTKELGRGTGLGLATVYAVVTQSEGFVEIDSAPGRGATFRIYLPAQPATADRHPSGSCQPLQPGSETVLIVEDEPLVRTLACTILGDSGYTVLQAGNGQEALDLARGYEGQIDILVTDVVMPRMGGRDLSVRLCESVPDLKVLFVSGYTDDIETVRAIRSGSAQWLEKPFTPRALTEAVRRALDGIRA